MRHGYAAFAVLAVLAIALVPIAMDEADAVASVNNEKTDFTFDNDDGGTLTFSVTNDGSAFTMDVTVTEGSSTVATLTGVTVERNAVTEVSVPMKDFKHVGTHTVVVTCTPASQFTDGSNVYNTFTATITVEKTLLSNWVTYLVIAIVVIIIAIFVYLKFRDQPKKKSDMTFEQLEEERKAQMAAKGEKKKRKDKEEKAPSTERKRYGASRSNDSGSEKESKKPSFSELEAERKEKASKKKEEKASKKDERSSGQTERQRYLASKKKKEE